MAKRLLQHERSSITRLANTEAFRGQGNQQREPELHELAKEYLGERDGRVSDATLRDAIAKHAIDTRAYQLTQQRTVQETQSAQTPGPQTSIFKLYGANLAKERTELQMSFMGTRGLGWEGDGFGEREIDRTRNWLSTKARSIAVGSNEVQMNIIAKRVLGLPD